MKIPALKYYLFAAALVFSGMQVTAQENSKPYKMTLELAADEKGDAAMTVTVKYNASLWDDLKTTHGVDPSVLKNQWKRAYPKYELTDFNISTVDQDRTSISKFKIQGFLKVNENGKWVAELDQKDPDITKITDNQFLLVDQDLGQSMKIMLPSSASNAKVDKDNFGKSILTYDAPVAGGGLSKIIMYLGIAVAAFGGFLFFMNSRGGLKTVMVKDAPNKKIDYHEPKKIDDAVVINTPTSAPAHSNTGGAADQQQQG
ncbi:MAG: hypothetical protein JST86_13920 [Bacteroidetes bacterium]|nr:hypothetical protein [Bacteroidota bacterium]